MNDQLYKADGGKLQPRLLIQGMPRALLSVSAVLSYGAQKYEAHSWRGVDPSRYEDAKLRHALARANGELNDDESGLHHLAHEACNDLFLLEQYLRDLYPTPRQFNRSLRFKSPPTGHKRRG